MNNAKFILILALAVVSLGCSTFPSQVEIKENHFRFENFKRDIDSPLEYVFLMCHMHKPANWFEPRQYISGQQNLWVKASISIPDVPGTLRVAYVNFDVHLDSGKSYMLNREIIKDKISIWIQEVDTGVRVSDVLVSDLDYDWFKKRNETIPRCKEGSV